MEHITISSTTDTKEDVQQAAKAALVEPEIQEPKGDLEQEPTEPNGRGRSGYQKRIDKLTREKYETRAEVKSLRERLEQLERARVSASVETTDQQAAAEPLTKEGQQEQPSEEQERLLAEHNQALESFHQKAEADAEFDEVQERAANIPLKIPPQEAIIITRTIADLPNGHEVFKYLSYHPEIVAGWEETVKTDPVKIIQQLHRISGALEFGTAAQESPAAEPRKVAPAPIRPVSGSPTRTSLPLDELPYQEFKAARERTAGARRKRGYGI
jgi:hypothetical protein